MLGRTDATAILQSAWRRDAVRAASSPAARCTRSARSTMPTTCSATPWRRRRRIRRSTPRGASCTSTRTRTPTRWSCSQIALEGDPTWTPALLGAAQALADDDPPQAVAAAKKALEINPSYVDAHVFLANAVDRPGPERRGARVAAEGAAVNPSSLEALAALAAMAYVEDKTAEFDAEVAKVLAISPNYGEVYRVAGELTAHNYRFDEAVALLRRGLALAAAESGHALGARHAPAAHRRRAGRAQALDASFKLFPRDKPTLNMLDDAGHARQVRHRARRRSDLQVRTRTRCRCCRIRDSAGAPGAERRYAERYEFTPKGPILIEIFPKHDDFAVRNVGLPGMIGALGACFGRVVTMDSPKAQAARRVPVGSDAVARARARRHDSDVEPARAAVAHRRHFGVRAEARAARMGAADGHGVRRDDERRTR